MLIDLSVPHLCIVTSILYNCHSSLTFSPSLYYSCLHNSMTWQIISSITAFPHWSHHAYKCRVSLSRVLSGCRKMFFFGQVSLVFSSSVWSSIFSPKWATSTGLPRYRGNRTEPPRTGLLWSMALVQTNPASFFEWDSLYQYISSISQLLLLLKTNRYI